MGCGTSKNKIHPPKRMENEDNTLRKQFSRKASSVNRRSQQRTKSLKLNIKKMEATLSGESFYVMEVCFKNLPGVISVKPGYCMDKKVKVEAVNLKFDSNKLSYENLLKAHFKLHNPTAHFKPKAPIQSIVYTHDAQQAIEAKQLLETM